jgi:hypothetical protein
MVKSKKTDFFIKSGFDENIARELEEYVEQSTEGKRKKKKVSKKCKSRKDLSWE